MYAPNNKAVCENREEGSIQGRKYPPELGNKNYQERDKEV
jgi:hypothetical protein